MMIAPMLATGIDLTDVGRYVVDDDWVLEQKIDGHRVMLIRPGTDRMRALGRNGDYTKGLPTAIRKWRLPDNVPDNHLLANMILDGELLGGELWVFDILDTDGLMNAWMLADRRRTLETILGALATPFRIVPQARSTAEKERLLLRAAQEDLEGVVAKRADSVYRAGTRSPYWLKAKYVVTADLVVTGLRDDGKESAAVGITTDGGLSFRTIGRCSLIGKPAVQVGDVVEVRYLYIPDRGNPRLFQPTLLRVRSDKVVAECTGADLKYTNRSVLHAL